MLECVLAPSERLAALLCRQVFFRFLQKTLFAGFRAEGIHLALVVTGIGEFGRNGHITNKIDCVIVFDRCGGSCRITRRFVRGVILSTGKSRAEKARHEHFGYQFHVQ